MVSTRSSVYKTNQPQKSAPAQSASESKGSNSHSTLAKGRASPARVSKPLLACRSSRQPRSKNIANIPTNARVDNSRTEPALNPNELLFDTTLYHFPEAKLNVGYTFGIELEVIVIVPLDQMIPRVPENMRKWTARHLRIELQKATELTGHDHFVREFVQEALTDIGLEVNSARSNDESIQKWSVEPEPAIETEDERLAHPKDVVVGIEIKTGALDFNAVSLAQVVKGIRAIQSRFTTVHNESCGLHVHVGLVEQSNGRQMRFDLQTCQNLVVLHTLFESELNRLHPLHVLDGHKWPECIGTRLQRVQSKNAAESAKVALSARSCGALVKKFSEHPDQDRNVTVNIQNLATSNTYHTIEYRQHEGSFDVEQILRRVQLCVDFTHWANGTSKETVKKLIWAVNNNFTLNVVQLLENLKVQPETVAYYAERLHDHISSEEANTNIAVKRHPSSEVIKLDPDTQALLEHSPFVPASLKPGSRKRKRTGGSKKASKPLKILGSGLFVGNDSEKYEVRLKVGAESSKSVEPSWVEESKALAMAKLSLEDLHVVQRTRARRWTGVTHETIVKRWLWTKPS